MPRLRRVDHDQRVAIHDHLHELRGRILVSIGALLVAFFGAYAVHNWLLRQILRPLPNGHERLATFSPTEPFFTVLKICFAAAIIVALPVWLYQLYAFVAPAAGRQSRRMSLIVVAGVASLFLVGVAFGYLVVLPVALKFLIGFGGDNFNVQLRAGEYIGFALTMMLAAGLMFEVPMAMVALGRLGVVNVTMLRKNRRFAIVIAAVLAALLPGGDPISMLLLMAPQIVLFEVGILLVKAFGQKPLWERGTWASDDDAAATTS